MRSYVETPARKVFIRPSLGIRLHDGVALFNQNQKILSFQESACAAHIILGFTDAQTARSMRIDEETAARYLTRTFQALDVHRRSGVFRAALEQDVITIRRPLQSLNIPERCTPRQIEAGQLAGYGLSAQEIGKASQEPTSEYGVRERLRAMGNRLLPDEFGFSHFAVASTAVLLAGLGDHLAFPVAA